MAGTVLVVGTGDLAARVASAAGASERAETLDELTGILSDGRTAGVVVAGGVDGLTAVEAAAVVRERTVAPVVLAGVSVPDEVSTAVGLDRVVTGGSTGELARRALTAVHERADGPWRPALADVLDSAPVFLCVVDSGLRLQSWNDRFASVTGYTDAELAAMELLDVVPGEGHEETVATLTRGGMSPPVETALVAADGTERPCELRAGTLGDGFVVTGVERSNRRAFAETLDHLHRTTRELVRSESKEEVCRRVVDAANVLVEARRTQVSLFDDQTGALAPVARVPRDDQAESFPDEDAAWQAFVEGETIVGPRSPDEQCTLLVPLGDHGMFALSVGAPPDDRTVELAETLAANAVVALDGVARERELRERDRELRERTERLAQLDEVNERIRRITHELMGATTREDIETIVCEGLAAADRFPFVWVGTVDRGRVEPTTWAGTERGYLDAIDTAVSASSAEDESVEPSLRAVQSGDPVVVASVAGELREGEWQREALAREYQSVLSLPLTHGGAQYGVLSVYAGTSGTFDEETQTVLGELVATIAHALRTVEQRQTLLSDVQVELTFDIAEENTTLFAFTAETGCTLAVDRVVTQSDGQFLVYGTVSGIDAEAFAGAVEASVGIRDGRVMADAGDHLRVELVVTGLSVVTTVTEYGGQFDELVAEAGSGTVSMTLSARANVSEFVDRFVDRHPDSTLVRRRERERTESASDAGPTLTDRQCDALETAYYSGFFDWPRASTGEEVADALDIASPTFQEHLRHATRKLVARFLDDQ